jgi:Pyridoxamine 5'-phosphate oxidase
MHETPAALERLQQVLDESDARGGAHLRAVITEERRLSATDLAEQLTGMRLLTLATTSKDGAPIAAPVDGIFYRGEFWFGSAPNSLRFQHIRQRPRVSATHLPGEHLGITIHGTAHIEGVPDALPQRFRDLCVEIYGDGWLSWGEGSLYARIEPRRVFTFSLDPEEAERLKAEMT